ncbi:hypothetical protein GQ457_11G018660 [Hibiscus cannabinus]
MGFHAPSLARQLDQSHAHPGAQTDAHQAEQSHAHLGVQPDAHQADQIRAHLGAQARSHQVFREGKKQQINRDCERILPNCLDSHSVDGCLPIDKEIQEASEFCWYAYLHRSFSLFFVFGQEEIWQSTTPERYRNALREETQETKRVLRPGWPSQF